MSKSKDLRESAAAYRLQKHTLRETNEVFRVSMRAENKEFIKQPFEQKIQKDSPEKLKTYVKEHPDDTQREMAEKCSDAAIRQSAKHGNAMEPQKKGSTVQKTITGKSSRVFGKDQGYS